MMDAWLTWTLGSCLNYTSSCFQIFPKTEPRCSPTSGHILSAGQGLFEKDSLSPNFPMDLRGPSAELGTGHIRFPTGPMVSSVPATHPENPGRSPVHSQVHAHTQYSLQLIQSPPQSSDPSVPDLRAQKCFPFSTACKTSLPSHMMELTLRQSPDQSLILCPLLFPVHFFFPFSSFQPPGPPLQSRYTHFFLMTSFVCIFILILLHVRH